jgi:hypothetical protein
LPIAETLSSDALLDFSAECNLAALVSNPNDEEGETTKVSESYRELEWIFDKREFNLTRSMSHYISCCSAHLGRGLSTALLFRLHAGDSVEPWHITQQFIIIRNPYAASSCAGSATNYKSLMRIN